MLRAALLTIALGLLWYSTVPLLASRAATGEVCCADQGGCPDDMYCAPNDTPCDPAAQGTCRPRGER